MTDNKDHSDAKLTELTDEDLENAQGGGKGAASNFNKPISKMTVLTTNENILTTNENITE